MRVCWIFAHSLFLVPTSEGAFFYRATTAPAISSTSAATIDLRSTGSGAGAKHLEDPSAAAGQSGP